MKHVLIISLILATLAGICNAKKKEPAPKVWSGYLIDKMCSKRMTGNPEKIKKHTKTCLTEEMCVVSGYGIITNKKFIPFDTKGNDIAANYLKTTPKEKDFEVEVTGVMKRNKIAVSEIKAKK